MTSPTYCYRAVVVDNYDGDSVTLDFDMGLNIWLMGQRIRLYGIDTPETRTGNRREEGAAARDWLTAQIPEGTRIVCETRLDKKMRDEKGKWGRWLGTLYLGERNLNAELLELGHAEPYFGGKR